MTAILSKNGLIKNRHIIIPPKLSLYKLNIARFTKK